MRTVNARVDLESGLAFAAVGDEGELIARLRAGDEAAFAALVSTYQTRLLRLAATVVASHAVAEDVVQDTWLAVIEGIDAAKLLRRVRRRLPSCDLHRTLVA